jgi:7-cyano-7-deazaguanine synthase
MMKQAMILCSGGLDSVTAAYHAKNTLKYKNLVLFFCNYNQRAYKGERTAVRYFAKQLRAKFVECDARWLDSVSTSLINKDKKPNKLRSLKDTKKESANWYVPCRNLVFLSCALACAESEFIKNKRRCDIITGFKNDGKETFPDTTIEFTNKLNKISSSTTAVKSRIISPLIKMDKEDIVSLALKYKIPIEKSFSCYVGPSKHCGFCLACKLRQAGFYWANIKDKTKYSS